MDVAADVVDVVEGAADLYPSTQVSTRLRGLRLCDLLRLLAVGNPGPV